MKVVNKWPVWLCLLLSLLTSSAQALSVYQVNARLHFGGQLKTDSAFVILENDTSRYEEHGAGGYSLVLRVEQNAGGSYTVQAEISADQGKGQMLLGSPALTLEKNQPAQVSFTSEKVGRVDLSLTLTEHRHIDESELQECKYVECD